MHPTTKSPSRSRIGLAILATAAGAVLLAALIGWMLLGAGGAWLLQRGDHEPSRADRPLGHVVLTSDTAPANRAWVCHYVCLSLLANRQATAVTMDAGAASRTYTLQPAGTCPRLKLGDRGGSYADMLAAIGPDRCLAVKRGAAQRFDTQMRLLTVGGEHERASRLWRAIGRPGYWRITVSACDGRGCREILRRTRVMAAGRLRWRPGTLRAPRRTSDPFRPVEGDRSCSPRTGDRAPEPSLPAAPPKPQPSPNSDWLDAFVATAGVEIELPRPTAGQARADALAAMDNWRRWGRAPDDVEQAVLLPALHTISPCRPPSARDAAFLDAVIRIPHLRGWPVYVAMGIISRQQATTEQFAPALLAAIRLDGPTDGVGGAAADALANLPAGALERLAPGATTACPDKPYLHDLAEREPQLREAMIKERRRCGLFELAKQAGARWDDTSSDRLDAEAESLLPFSRSMMR